MIKKHLWIKISIPILVAIALIIAVFLVFLNLAVAKSQKILIENRIEKEISALNYRLHDIQQKALIIASYHSDGKFVRQAYTNFYKTNNLEESALIIKDRFTAKKELLKSHTSQEIRIHYHLPVRSFYRSWTERRGDDLSAFRHSIKQVISTNKPATGIEIGRSGLVIRGIVPITNKAKECVGSVECFFSIDKLTANLKRSEKEEYAIFVPKDKAEIASNEYSLNLKSDNIALDNFTVSSLSSTNFRTNLITTNFVKKGLAEQKTIWLGAYAFAVRPILDISKNQIGFYVYQYKVEQKTTNQIMVVMVFVGFILFISSLFVVMLLTKRIVSKPILNVVLALKNDAKNMDTLDIKSNREDEIGQLYDVTNDTLDRFKKIIHNIQETILSVSQISGHLSAASSALSQSTNEQASTTEEISTAMEQMLATVSSNVENADTTGSISAKSVTKTALTKDLISEALQAASKISAKTSIISEIAAKTDILSINAAIEAARAGQSGKGFSVVATEIRKLADKSQKASLEIDELSESGKKLSQLTSEQVEELILEITKSVEMVQQIVVSSKEQQNGIDSINHAIVQLAETVNSNSTTSEEMAASATDLWEQVEQLKKMMLLFESEN